jgi:hypothetical protein
VLYLVVKQANISVNISKDPFMGNHGIRFLTEDDAGNRAGYYPSQKGYEGMSMSSYEAPVWHATAFDPNEMNQVKQLASEVDSGANLVDKNGVLLTDVYKQYNKTDGMSGYARKSVESMDDKLTAALLGSNKSLQ